VPRKGGEARCCGPDWGMATSTRWTDAETGDCSGVPGGSEEKERETRESSHDRLPNSSYLNEEKIGGQRRFLAVSWLSSTQKEWSPV